MRFDDRKEFIYDPLVFKRDDTKTALQIHAEYVRKHSANPAPHFFEVDRRVENIDHLWHMPLTDRTIFSREIDMYAINYFDKPEWTFSKLQQIQPKRTDTFWLANNILQQVDYFPQRGDLVYWNGYRYLVEKVVIPPSAYWQQTNVWLGLVIVCIIPPDGDARPLVNVGKAVPKEASAIPLPPEQVPLPPLVPYTPHKIGKQGL